MMCWTQAYAFTCDHKAGSNPPYICEEAIQGRFCVHCWLSEVIPCVCDQCFVRLWQDSQLELDIAGSGRSQVGQDTSRDRCDPRHRRRGLRDDMAIHRSR